MQTKSIYKGVYVVVDPAMEQKKYSINWKG